jgi:hypothetical protein
LVEIPGQLWFGTQMLRCYGDGDQHVEETREPFGAGPSGRSGVPDEQVVTAVDQVLDPSCLPDEVADRCGSDHRRFNGIVRCPWRRILEARTAGPAVQAYRAPVRGGWA